MNISSILNNAVKVWARTQAYARAWRCPDKILVIESDDWGSIRTSSAAAYQKLSSNGYDMEKSCWSVDALETDDDMVALYDVLKSFKDNRGHPGCITGNMVVANPNFPAVRASSFSEYIYEPVATTLSQSPGRKNVSCLWQEGMEKGLFRPQFHAREHIRWWDWLDSLQKNSKETIETFDLGMCGLPAAVSKERQSFFKPPYIDSLLLDKANIDLKSMVIEGIDLFEKQFGFKSLSAIAPNCTWTDQVEKIWAACGVRYIQGGYCQQYISDKGVRLIPHYLGQPSKFDGRYLVRNCFLEPAKDAHDDHWKTCLNQINRAFRRNTPAIVSSHRVNYIGSIFKENRERGLDQLRLLLEGVVAQWPDVSFLSSAELGFMLEHNIRHVTALDGKEDKIFPK